MTRFKITNATRSRKEYLADIVSGDGQLLGYVERAESSKMLGYRSGSYRAHIDGAVVATGQTLADLREELREHFAAENPDARESW